MTKKTEPRWLTLARQFLGLREIKGAKHAPEIVQFWRDIKRGGIKDDETPWCAAFVGAVLEHSGIKSSRFESAKSYLSWGVKLQQPAVGAIAVLSRTGGGHVAFVVGQNSNGDLLLLGGNQNDAVNIAAFSRNRVEEYRWPTDEPLPVGGPLPQFNAANSTRES
ncbi:NlpC/P60 family protein [Limnobaculum xujianqingii]|uniref:NlpC/P60 family protein n=1 Tax=Limnobaculum xujianqingii TaxID=2738837 RepID=UPI00112C4B97|nr:TIGR02594 family protein [Limnobaculum xujianqingii]